MYNFNSFLQELSENSGVDFDIQWENGEFLYQSIPNIDKLDNTEVDICLGKQNAKLILKLEHKLCAALIKYCVENKYQEIFSIRDNILINLIQGKSIEYDKIEKSLPFLMKGYNLILVSVEGSKYEAINIVRQMYNEQDMALILYEDNLLVIGKFEDVIEHARSIREAIISNLYCRCYIAYSNIVYFKDELKKAYKSAKESLIIGRKIEAKGEIYNYGNMIFEKTVYNISESIKEEYLERFKEKFDAFDSEMINTIEEFVNSGLNISDAAKKLYVHRNTLIYRLEKISKDTGYDIRDFKQAAIFMIAFLIWKERR